MSAFGFKEETWKLIEQYNEAFPEEKLGTLVLRPDITDETMIYHINKAISSGEPITEDNRAVYGSFKEDRKAGILY